MTRVLLFLAALALVSAAAAQVPPAGRELLAEGGVGRELLNFTADFQFLSDAIAAFQNGSWSNETGVPLCGLPFAPFNVPCPPNSNPGGNTALSLAALWTSITALLKPAPAAPSSSNDFLARLKADIGLVGAPPDAALLPSHSRPGQALPLRSRPPIRSSRP